MEHAFIIRLVTGITTKPRLSGNIFLNMKTCENGGPNFSENLRILALKLLELLVLITKSFNLQLFTLLLYGFRVRSDLWLFSVLSPFTEKSMSWIIKY